MSLSKNERILHPFSIFIYEWNIWKTPFFAKHLLNSSISAATTTSMPYFSHRMQWFVFLYFFSLLTSERHQLFSIHILSDKSEEHKKEMKNRKYSNWPKGTRWSEHKMCNWDVLRLNQKDLEEKPSTTPGHALNLIKWSNKKKVIWKYSSENLIKQKYEI